MQKLELETQKASLNMIFEGCVHECFYHNYYSHYNSYIILHNSYYNQCYYIIWGVKRGPNINDVFFLSPLLGFFRCLTTHRSD